MLLVLCGYGIVFLACLDAIVEASVCAHWACAFWKDAEAPTAGAYLIFGFDPRVWPTVGAGSVMSEWASVKQKHSNSEKVPGGQGALPWWPSVVGLLAQRSADLGRPTVYISFSKYLLSVLAMCREQSMPALSWNESLNYGEGGHW